MRQKEVYYMGHHLKKNELKPDSLKIEAIMGIPRQKL